MCGRYSLIVTDDLGQRFRVHDPVMGLKSRFNVTPGSRMPVICAGDGRRCVLMEWGLVSPRGPAPERRIVNARAETVAVKPAFRSSFFRRRCLVPASGFYEWKTTPRDKIPYYFRLSGGEVFAFAGLYTLRTTAAGTHGATYAIITTPANPLAAGIHDRMPAILAREDEDRWLDPGAGREELERLLVPYPADAMECWEVSSAVNRTDRDDEGLIRPVAASRDWW